MVNTLLEVITFHLDRVEFSENALQRAGDAFWLLVRKKNVLASSAALRETGGLHVVESASSDSCVKYQHLAGSFPVLENLTCGF